MMKSFFQEIKSFIHKYLKYRKNLKIWLRGMWCLPGFMMLFRKFPIFRLLLRLWNGKTLLKTIRVSLLPTCFLNGSTSVSAVFVSLIWRRDSCFDETDFSRSDTTSEIIKILNAGFQTETPVLRAEEEKGKKEECTTPILQCFFGPQNTGNTKICRCGTWKPMSPYSMQERTRKDIPSNLNEDFEEEALAIRNKLLAFRFTNSLKVFLFKNFPMRLILNLAYGKSSPLYSVVEGEGKKKVLEFIQAKQNPVLRSVSIHKKESFSVLFGSQKRRSRTNN